MLTKRIIPCLDVKDGRTVKGTEFINLRDAGDPAELAAGYAQNGADELVFLDISATREKRATLHELVTRVAQNIDIPFTVGGGISSERDVEELLKCGADKISLNSAAVKNPELISSLSREFGSQCIVLAIDYKICGGRRLVHTHGGTRRLSLNALDWAAKAVTLGAGELLLTSMDQDGTGLGFDTDFIHEVSSLVTVPLIASGGAGSVADFLAVFKNGQADGALAAGLFHYGKVTIPELKNYLQNNKIKVRNLW